MFFKISTDKWMGLGFWVKGDGIIGMCGGDNKFPKRICIYSVRILEKKRWREIY